MRVLYILCMAFMVSSLSAQDLRKGYTKTKIIERTEASREGLISYVIFNQDKSLIAMGSHFRPSHFEVYRISDWELLGSFSIKSYAIEWMSFFDEENEGVIYIDNGKKKLVKANFLTGTTEKVKRKEAPKYETKGFGAKAMGYVKYWKQTYPMNEYYYIDDLLVEIGKTKIVVYRKDS